MQEHCCDRNFVLFTESSIISTLSYLLLFMPYFPVILSSLVISKMLWCGILSTTFCNILKSYPCLLLFHNVCGCIYLYDYCFYIFGPESGCYYSVVDWCPFVQALWCFLWHGVGFFSTLMVVRPTRIHVDDGFFSLGFLILSKCIRIPPAKPSKSVSFSPWPLQFYL